MTMYCYFVRGAQHAALARTSIESVRKADPSAQVFVMTDEQEPNWKLDAAIGRLDSGMPIMLANLEAQVRAVCTAPYGSTIWFLDTDTLLLEPLPELHTDLFVTWRDHVLKAAGGEKIAGIAGAMPYNYGVIGTIAALPAMEAFIWMRERVRIMSDQHQQWYGNQLALAQLAGPRPDAGICTDARPLKWTPTQYGNSVRITKAPCEQFNYTPQMVGEKIHGKRMVLHFKGGSRGLMESYAKRLGLGWYSVEDVKAAA